MTRAGLAAALLAVVLVGCVADRPDCAELPPRVELALSAEGLDPSEISTCRGREVTLRVSSEVDGVLHVHGYDEHVPATTIAAGAVTELTFTAARSGQFPIELHTDDDTEGNGVGVLTVHEP